jgi:hypothetical protein
MERSEGVSVVLNHIMKTMDRSGDRLLRSFNRFEGLDIGVAASPKAPEPVAASASRQRPAAPSGLTPGRQIPGLPQRGGIPILRSHFSMRSSRAASRKPA